MKLLDQLKNAVKRVLARHAQRKLDMLLGRHYLEVVVKNIDDWPMFKCYYSQLETFSQLCVKYPSLMRQLEKKMSGRTLPKELLGYLYVFNNQAGFPATISEDLLKDPVGFIQAVNALSCQRMAKALADDSFTADDQAYQVSRLVEHHTKERYYPSYRQLSGVGYNFSYEYDTSPPFGYKTGSIMFFCGFWLGAGLMINQILKTGITYDFSLGVMGILACLAGVALTSKALWREVKESRELDRMDSLDVLNHILSSVPDTWEAVAKEQSMGAAYVRATAKHYGAYWVKNMSPKVACLYGMLSYPLSKRGLTITSQGYIRNLSSANAKA